MVKEIRDFKGRFAKGNISWTTGKHHSEETRMRISKSNIGKNTGKHYSPSTEFKKGNIPWMSGKHLSHSEETKRKISEGNKGKFVSLITRKIMSDKFKGIPLAVRFGEEKARKMIEQRRLKITGMKQSKKTIAKRVSKMIGRHQSNETKKSISIAQMNKHYSPNTEFKKGHKTNVGRICSEYTKRRIGEKNSIALKGKFALEKHPNWQGGKSFEPYSPAFNKGLKEKILKRDSYRCQECFRHQDELFNKNGKKAKLVVHHIDFDKKNSNQNNLISLCPSCHSQTNYNREDWIDYFNTRRINNGS